VEQRFGVDIGSFRELVKIIELTKSVDAKLGVHFHIPSILIGVERWFSVYRAIVKYIKLLESALGKKVSVIDIGGGWSPRSFDEVFLPRLAEIVSYAHRKLPGLEEFLMEPGRALVEPGICLMTRVIEVRGGAKRKDVVVDASVAEMPLAPVRPHTILYYDMEASEFRAIGRGHDRILGRLCMEEDVLAMDIKIPEGVKEDDVLLFLNVGAYDISMSYRFGRG
jgi:diaminopimelate decarboxylase